MNLNPVNLIDDLLRDYVSPRVRKVIHTILALAVALVTIWLGVNGDWEQFAVALFAAIYAAANRANTDTPPSGEVEDVTEYSGEVSGNPEVGPDEDETDEPLPF